MLGFADFARRGVSLRSSKLTVASETLGRPAHADVFELDPSPVVLVVLIAGAGVEEDEYRVRGQTVIPVFDLLLGRLAADGCRAAFVHVTAPFDLPFARFAEEPAAAARWTAHFVDELLAPWPQLPFVVGGFSSAVALALNGLHRHTRCLGGFGVAPARLPERFRPPARWSDPLRLYVGTGDPVCDRPATRAALARAEREGATVLESPAASHGLAAYATADCLGEVIRWAERLAAPLLTEA